MKNRVEFSLSGRSGKLQYIEDQKSVSAYVEMSGSSNIDLLVDLDGIETWSNGEELSGEDRGRIRKAFEQWAKETENRCEW